MFKTMIDIIKTLLRTIVNLSVLFTTTFETFFSDKTNRRNYCTVFFMPYVC